MKCDTREEIIRDDFVTRTVPLNCSDRRLRKPFSPPRVNANCKCLYSKPDAAAFVAIVFEMTFVEIML